MRRKDVDCEVAGWPKMKIRECYYSAAPEYSSEWTSMAAGGWNRSERRRWIPDCLSGDESSD